MSVLASPIRGLRLMTVAVILVMLRYLLELGLVAWSLTVESFADIATVLTWSGRLHLMDMAALTLLIVGVAMNVGELRRRRVSPVAGVIALVTFAITFAVHAWMYDLLQDLAATFRGEVDFTEMARRMEDLEAVPLRTFLATVAYLGGLFATVLMVRAYAMTDGNLGMREQARAIGGLLVVLLIADTFYRFSYGLGGGATAFGVFGLMVAIALSVFWFLCHRRLGNLFDTAKYYLRATEHVPMAEARVPAAAVAVAKVAPARTTMPPITPVEAAAPPPPPSRPPFPSSPRIVPLAAAAPAPPAANDGPPPVDGGPRFLR